MAAPKKNSFWKKRTTHGREKIFTTPQILFDAACEYFQFIEDNPLYDVSIISGKRVRLPKLGPFTLEGLCIFLNVNTKYFNQFEASLRGKDDEVSQDFSNIIQLVKEIIYNHKFEGAATGFFNSNLISRDLGMIDRKQHSGDPETPITVKAEHELSPEMEEEFRQFLIKRYNFQNPKH